MRPIAAALAALLIACVDPTPDAADTSAADTAGGAAAADSVAPASTKIELRTDSSRYPPGGKVTLTLVNRTDATYAFNPCTRVVMRETNGGREAIEEPQRVCTMEAWLLEPRGTRSGDTELPDSLEPGRYSIGVSLSLQGQTPSNESELAISEPFTVAR